MVPSKSVFVAVLALAACGDDDPAIARWSIDSADVVFTARRGEAVDVYRRSGIHDPVAVTRHDAVDNFARLAPGGAMAFQSRRSGAIDIYTMNADGSGLANLTDHEAFDVLPAWAPDGMSIAFMSTRGFDVSGGFTGHVYLVRPDGSDLRQVTQEPLTSALGPQDWGSDGILLSRQMGGSIDIFRLNVETGSEERVTSDPSDEYGAAFSHDGTRIAFHAEIDGVSNIMVMNSDGTGRRAVTSGAGLRYGPRWSPDDAWLMFAEQGAGPRDYDLKAVRVADGTVRDVVVTAEDEREGDWVRR